eukprot:CAMPEP_0170524658 /NCGR_PEP_ID=MMETSP0209-20121228/10156_1 /TAXON_ID=665100 ORGANISM="Litonotus pictus, Strain P1" /NCGR_SAMPLE_ID=MMETSP0209 /ASSEMBLY_ACC=CAM_ASM_000301 /LENGTH=122 /DNA_ID=CAMNT_0010813503 /DNA_START=26 /DNA_END=394 /DNA_ORIENTATION=-
MSKPSEKSYYSNDILLKDETEHKADILSSEDINKIIQKQQTQKNKQSSLSEYKIINDNEDEDNSIATKTLDESKEIQEMSNEISQQTCVEVEEDHDNAEEHLDSDKINDLKQEVMGGDLIDV